ncbi:hypothetical protein KKF84_03725 [Myxococcota bacterium]|nr:hypothetical protein [Myxococcota bacterium]MBU1534402.1 hypothetical protein [Myxococcota bacterium]
MNRQSPARNTQLAMGVLLLSMGNRDLPSSSFRRVTFRNLLGRISVPVPPRPGGAAHGSASGNLRPQRQWERIVLLAGKNQWGQLKASAQGRELLSIFGGNGTDRQYRLWIPRLLWIPYPNVAGPRAFVAAAKRGVLAGLNENQWRSLFVNTVKSLGEWPLPLLFTSLVKDLPESSVQRLTLRIARLAPSMLTLFHAHYGTIKSFSMTRTLGLPLRWDSPTVPRDLPVALFSHVFYKGGRSIIQAAAPSPLGQAEILRLSGKLRLAIESLKSQPLEKTADGRLRAAFTALRFMDREAALKHLRWAFSMAIRKDTKGQILHLIHTFDKAPPTLESITEEYALTPAQTMSRLLAMYQFPTLAHLVKSDRKREKILGIIKKLSIMHPQVLALWVQVSRGPEGGSFTIPAFLTTGSPPARERPTATAPIISTPWPDEFLRLIRTNSVPRQWRRLFLLMTGSPWLPHVADYYLHQISQTQSGKIIAAEGHIIAGNIEKSALLFSQLGHCVLPREMVLRIAIDLYLKYGLRNRAAQMMQQLMLIQMRFPHPSEIGRSDLRLMLAMELLAFYHRAGFKQEYGAFMTRLLANAAAGSPHRKASVLAILKNAGLPAPGFFESASLEMLLRRGLAKNDHALLKHIIPLLEFLFPLHPQLALLRCALGVRKACHQATRLGPFVPTLLPYPALLPGSHVTGQGESTRYFEYAIRVTCGLSSETLLRLRHAALHIRRIMRETSR